jgi:hypothetical protein
VKWPQAQSSGKHTLVLVQHTSNYQTRTYMDFPSVGASMDGMLSLLSRFTDCLLTGNCNCHWNCNGNGNGNTGIAAIVQMYEHKLRELNPAAQHITYDVSQLHAFIDSLYDMAALVFDGNIGAYVPHDKEWIKSKVFRHLSEQAR